MADKLNSIGDNRKMRFVEYFTLNGLPDTTNCSGERNVDSHLFNDDLQAVCGNT